MTEDAQDLSAINPETRVALRKVKRPVGRPPKYGAFSGAELTPIAKAKDSDIRAILAGAKVVVGTADSVPIALLAGNLAKIELIDRYLSAYGLFDEENQPRQTTLKIYFAAVNAAARLCDQLGMTPQSRLRLGLGMIQAKKDLGSAMHDAREEGGEEE